MTRSPKQFPYRSKTNSADPLTFQPLLPLSLTHQGVSVAGLGLLDTGSAVNVMPLAVGLQLGLVWEQQKTPLRLAGALANVECRGVLLTAAVAGFPPVRLAFAWALFDDVPLILGQVNFLQEFDVCFYRSRLGFDVKPKS